MVKLPEHRSKTVSAIYKSYQDKNDDPRREHLGASVIGHYCNRHLWYSFRWANPPDFDGRMLRLFDTGHREEARIAEDLIASGVKLKTFDPETGKQWLFSWLGGHFGGSCDGIGYGFPEAPKSIHVFEAKTFNAKWFKTLKAKGVREAKPEHFAQMQTYMHGAIEKGIKARRAFYMACCKDTDEIYIERVQYKKPEAEALQAKAKTVVFSPEPLEKITEDQSSYLCTWCDHKSICHFEQASDLQRNCRTCLSSTPREDGTWWCDQYETELTLEDQRAGCKAHLFIPKLLPWEAVDASKEKREVIYRRPDGSIVVDGNYELKNEPAPAP